MVKEMAGEIVSTSRDLNNILATGKVAYAFRTHYVDTANDINGIGELIAAILKANGSTFPKGSEDTSLREIVIHGAMYLADIETKVRQTFGFERYPTSSLKVYLSNHKAGHVFETIQLKGHEDQGRTCPKPRAKYFLAE